MALGRLWPSADQLPAAGWGVADCRNVWRREGALASLFPTPIVTAAHPDSDRQAYHHDHFYLLSSVVVVYTT